MPDLLKEGINLGDRRWMSSMPTGTKQAKGTALNNNAMSDKRGRTLTVLALGEITEETVQMSR